MSDSQETPTVRVEREGPIPEPPPRDIADPDVELAPLDAGERYEARAALGEGGMGEVRLCRDRIIGREVALKSVHAAHAGSDELRSRFIREARVQGQLEHPSIVPVYDFGTDAAGNPFFTMKRVRGVTLQFVIEVLRRGEETAAKVYSLHKLLGAFVQVCLAIDFAHERGVLHRDLKPSNVMLGRYGEVYVLDWGVAKVRSGSREHSSSAFELTTPADTSNRDLSSAEPTTHGALLGTLGYMAPEQIRGETVDARADIYALGAILFEILTLEPLHGPAPAVAMIKRTMEGVDARASSRSPNRNIAPELEALCIRACARDRAERIASARELAEAIEAYLSGDRDLELRRTLSKEHLDRAERAAGRALGPNGRNFDRAEALREAGRAVALAPTDRAALDLMVRVLTTPPDVPPSAVGVAVERARLESQRRMLPRVALIYGLAWLLLLPVPAYLGILDWRLMALPLVAWTVAAVAALVAHYRFERLQRALWVLNLLGSIAVAVSSVLFGPMVLLPTMVIMLTMGSILVTKPSLRPVLLVFNGLALLAPTGLAWLGWHPVTHDVDVAHGLRVGLKAFALTRDGAFGVLGSAHLAMMLIGAGFAARYRDALTLAETKNELQAWQLRHLVPSEAGRALGAPDAPLSLSSIPVDPPRDV